jgi:hypothetical protein
MWICPKCGESHHDQFKECWKCVGAEMEQHVAEGLPPHPTPASRQRPLRSIGAIVFRMLVGFILGGVFGAAASHRHVSSFTETVLAGVIVGAVVASIVGFLVWVVFPFEPTTEEATKTTDHAEPGAPRDTAVHDLSVPLETAALGGWISLSVNGRNIEVKIPAGVVEGKILRLQGQAPGDADLMLKIRIDATTDHVNRAADNQANSN